MNSKFTLKVVHSVIDENILNQSVALIRDKYFSGHQPVDQVEPDPVEQQIDPVDPAVVQQCEPQASGVIEKQPNTNRKKTIIKKTIKIINKKNKENNNKNKEINKEYNKNKEKNNKNKENNDQEIPLKKCRIIIVQFDGMDAYIKKAMPAKAKAAK